jgi:hypothetical protein
VSSNLKAEYFEISHLGYKTTTFSIAAAMGEEKTYYLEVQAVQLKEVPVVPYDARGMVEMAFRNILKNYSDVPNRMTGFYRESVQQRKDYLSVSEAVVEIYKAPYTSIQYDQVRIYKGRKAANVKKADTLMVTLQGGPNVALLLDVVKNTDLSIALDTLDNYRFEFSGMVNIDDELHWIIAFAPDVVKDDPLYIGKLYISQEDVAITRAEFSLDLRDAEKASNFFVRKKPAGLIFTPTSTAYLVTYKKEEGKNYLNYVRVDIKFRCDWKRKLFKNFYSIMTELAITDRSEENVSKFPGQEVFRSSMVFAEKVEDFTDDDFWGEHNIIDPEESIESAIKKLAKGMAK